MTKNDDLLAALEHDPASAPLEPRARVLVDYAIKLTRAPQAMTEADIKALRAAGLSDVAIHDAAAIVAYFNWLNRRIWELSQQQGQKRSEERFAAFADVVNVFKETEINRQKFL